ncbi:MAG: SDR family oxidoreductase [Actinomycetota bacterium]|nr:SDR family oxidoreductase [Actinomycetota bacterium]
MSGRVVVVTGASAGVGRATARAFAARGDAVALLARGEEGLEAANEEVERAGSRALTCPLDVADATAVEEAATAVEAELGPIDVWVNNAMTAAFAPVVDTTSEEFRRLTEVSYLGYVHGTLAALRRMRARDRGVIVQVGSALAHRAIPLQAGYCAAKHAVRGFTDALRAELLHDASNIRLTMVQLPGLNTPQFGWVKTTLTRHPRPVAPIYQPEVAARAIVWAADYPRREMWVGAVTPFMIWASRLAPGLADHYLARTNIDAQQTDQPIDPARPHYLWSPLPGDHGAHGIFDDEARARSSQLWLTTHRRVLAVLATAGAATGLRAWLNR